MNVKDLKNLKRIWAFKGEFAVYEKLDKKSGLINRQGEIIFPADKYDFAFHMRDSIYNFQVCDSVIPDIFYDANLRKEVEKPAMPTSNKQEMPAFAAKLNDAYWCGVNRIAYKEGDVYGIMDEIGKVIVAPQYKGVGNAVMYNYKNDKIWVKNQDDKMGYIDLDGKELVPCEYQYINWCRRIGLYKIEPVKGKWGFMDENRKVIIPAIYDSIDAEDTFGLNEIAVSKDGRCYFINEKQEEVKVF